jgi:hypothetical protein
MAKIYTYLDHSKRPTRYAYVCADSIAEAAGIIGLPLSRIKDHITVTKGDKASEYGHLKHGEMVYAAESNKPVGMSLLDLERIAALGYLKMAKMSLHQCDLTADEKARLSEIVGLIDELRADVSDRLEGKYKGR